MRSSAKWSVALHCLIYIAEFEGQAKITSELLAKSTGCNAATIRSLLDSLKKKGLIIIRRGVGGSELIKSPKEITIQDVYLAVDPGPLSETFRLHPYPNDDCPVGHTIYSILEGTYTAVGETMMKKMGTITLQDLLDDFQKQSKEYPPHIPSNFLEG